MKNRSACLRLSFAMVLIMGSYLSPALGGNRSSATDWFRDAGFGVFMHFLPADAQGLERVKEFDVHALADQLEAAGARYFVLTLGQNSGYMNAPNPTYDRWTGYRPGERCSTRDLPLDLHRVLHPRGIRLMLYLPCQAPNRDVRAQKAFGLAQGPKDQPIDLAFAQKWAEVIHDWSSRYGDKVAGWWFDGGYEWVGFNNEIAARYAEAVKRGNPRALVTFNPGVGLKRWTAAEDYTAGELNKPFDHIPTDRWVAGSQWHTLTHLGSRWGTRDTPHPDARWASWVRDVVQQQGVVTLDVGPNWESQPGPIGSISDAQMAQLKAVGRAVTLPATPDLYVSPHGHDSWSGRLAAPNADASDGPLASLKAAQRRVRQLRAADPDRTHPVVVALRGGHYWLREPLEFTPADSGTRLSPVIYQAYQDERPVLSGGRALSGWQVNAQGHWTVALPEAKAGTWSFTQLFVNDQRRFRPRLPETGYYKIARQLDPSPKAAGKGHDRFGFEAGEIRSDWANLHDVEAMAFHHWAASRMPIAEVNSVDHILTVQGHTTGDSGWARFAKGHRYFLENVREALKHPGQWYLDRPSGRLTYIPCEGETPGTTSVVAPRLRNLLLLRGDVEKGRWTQYLTFHGLTFAHANWATPPAGQSFPQAEINLGAAVAAMGARHILLQNCAVRHVGEYALGFGPGCRFNQVVGCELVDLGAGGIKIGSALPTVWGNTRGAPSDAAAVVSHHTIEDCLIAHGGRLHPAGIGVWVGHSPYNAIRHNDVFDLYYSAFSLGWVWGYGPSQAHHNEVAFNHAHHIGQRVLSDMGCIYTLGIAPGTTIHDNYFHDVISYGYGGWGLYTDEGSTGVVMTNNLVVRCSRGGFHQHYGKENRIANNILAFGGEHQIQRTRTEEHTSFFLERNIVTWDNDSPLFGSNWKDNNFKVDYNLYWHAGKPITFPGGLDLAQWREQRGQDLHSLITDPGFVDAKNDDFRLKPDAPALKLGFKPFDYTRAGRRPEPMLTRDLPEIPAGFEESAK